MQSAGKAEQSKAMLREHSGIRTPRPCLETDRHFFYRISAQANAQSLSIPPITDSL